MAKYLLMHVNQGTVGGKQILGKNNAVQMQSPQMVIQGSPLFPELSEAAYGMRLFVETYRGHKHVYHGGNLDGFSLQLSLLPNDNMGVIVLTNLDGTTLRDLIPRVIYDRLLGLEPIDWVARYHDIEEKDRTQQLTAEKKGYTGRREGTHPAHELAEYAGEFENPGYGTVAIRVDSSQGAPKLVMKLNDVEWPLEHFHYDTFQVPEKPARCVRKTAADLPDERPGRDRHTRGEPGDKRQRHRVYLAARQKHVRPLVPPPAHRRI
jgi:hypothetical protein